MGNCKNCKHWVDTYCERIEIRTDMYEPNSWKRKQHEDIAYLAKQSGDAVLRTRPEFGCVLFEPKS